VTIQWRCLLQGWFFAGCAFLVVVMVGLLKNGAQRAYSKSDDVRCCFQCCPCLHFCEIHVTSALGIPVPALLLSSSCPAALWCAEN
jgi:hypothetical protein